LRYQTATGASRLLRPESAMAFKPNRHRVPDLWWSMIFSENQFPLFRIMLQGKRGGFRRPVRIFLGWQPAD
jgi:hypothetical protein